MNFLTKAIDYLKKKAQEQPSLKEMIKSNEIVQNEFNNTISRGKVLEALSGKYKKNLPSKVADNASSYLSTMGAAAGMTGGMGKRIPNNVKNEMAWFIDAKRSGNIPSIKDYEYMHNLAKDYGLKLKPNQTLDNLFEEALHNLATKSQVPVRNRNNSRYMGSKSYTNYVPGQSGQLER